MLLPSLTVHDMATGGEGIAHAADGRIVFISGAVPGDVVDVEVEQDRPRYLRGSVASVLDASDERVTPPCPHVADGCGGCGWQHVSVPGQRRWKQRIAEESLRRLGRLETRVREGPVLVDDGFRTTLRMIVDDDGRLGFRGARSHHPVPIDRCLVAHPALSELIRPMRLPGAREVTLRISLATGERLAIVDPSVPDDAVVPAGVELVGLDEIAADTDAWLEETVAGVGFQVSARSFFQTRHDGAEALVEAVRRAGEGKWGQGRLVDLYGGVGLFAATLGEGMEIELVEADVDAAADAEHNLAHLDAVVTAVAVDDWSPSPADVAVADPPRAGLGRVGVERLVATGADRVATVHCDAASYGRDAGLLAEHGYQLAWSQMVDLFTHTPHVEIVSRFDRGDR